MIKAFIFDYDDTLYYGVNWDYWYKLKNNFFFNHFKYLGNEQIEEILRENNCLNEPTKLDIFAITVKIEGSCKSWLDFRESLKFNYEARKNAIAVPNEELLKFATAGKCYIVTNSSKKVLIENSKFLNIDLSLFDHIYFNDFQNPKDLSKTKYYLKIMNDNNLRPEEIVVIGDSYRVDLQPAENLGMKIYKCKNGFTFNSVLKKIN